MIDAARDVARRLLADVGTRVAHSECVARQAELAARHLGAPLRHDVHAAAWLHDIGYGPEVKSSGFHPLDGARWLREHDFDERVCSLVAWHTGALYEARERGLVTELQAEFIRPEPEALDALTWADLTSSPIGRPVSPADRLREISDRYPPDSSVHRAITAATPELLASVRRTETSQGMPHA